MIKKEDFSSFFLFVVLKNNTHEKELWYNIVMQIEIEELTSARKNLFLWDMKGARGMDGGNVTIKLNDATSYQFNVQDFMFYVVHRSYGNGFMKNCQK